MKKLMVAVAAVATALGLYAAESTFTDNAWKAAEKTAETWKDGWSGVVEDSEKVSFVVNETSSADNYLKLETGSDALTRNVNGDGAAYTITDGGFYIDTTIDLKTQTLDEVPTLSGSEKLAIFALDSSDLDDAAPKTKNLYAIAGYGAAGKALFNLGELDDRMLGKQRIVVKAYKNVAAEGTRSGFIVAAQRGDEIGGSNYTPLKVWMVYPITESGVDWANPIDPLGSSPYLGGDAPAISGTVEKWVTAKSLLLCMDSEDTNNGVLAAVDFKGNADLSEITFTETNPGFEADAFVMTITGENVGAIELVRGEGMTLSDGQLVSTTGSGTVTIKVPTLAEYPVITVTGDGVTNNGDGTYTFNFENGKTITFTGSAAAVYVDGVAYATLGEALKAANGAVSATLKLGADATWPEGVSFTGTDVTLDLAGKTLTIGDGLVMTIVSGALTIVDSGIGGKVIGVVENYAMLNIQAGIFDGEVYNDKESSARAVISGGLFAKKFNGPDTFTLAANVAEGYEAVADGDYWKVQKGGSEPETPTVKPEGEAVEVKAADAEAAAAAVEIEATSPDAGVVSDAAYKAYFTKTATLKEGTTGTYLVTAVLTDEIVKAADVTAEVAGALDGVATEATITTAKPGLFYSVKYNNALDNWAGVQNESTRVMATSPSMTIALPKIEGNAMFYQIQVNVKAK